MHRSSRICTIIVYVCKAVATAAGRGFRMIIIYFYDHDDRRILIKFVKMASNFKNLVSEW